MSLREHGAHTEKIIASSVLSFSTQYLYPVVVNIQRCTHRAWACNQIDLMCMWPKRMNGPGVWFGNLYRRVAVITTKINTCGAHHSHGEADQKINISQKRPESKKISYHRDSRGAHAYGQTQMMICCHVHNTIERRNTDYTRAKTHIPIDSKAPKMPCVDRPIKGTTRTRSPNEPGLQLPITSSNWR